MLHSDPIRRVTRRTSAAGVLAIALTAATFAQSQPGKPSGPEQIARMLAEQRNMDARVGLLVPAAAPLEAQQAEVDALRAATADLRVEFDVSTGATRSLWNMAGFLTAPDGRSPRAIAEDFIASRSALMGLTDSDVVDIELTDEVYSSISGVTHLYYRQRVNGIPLYNAQLHVNVTRDGRILSVNNAFLPNLTAAIGSLRPALTAAAAVRAVGDYLGVRGVVPAVDLVAADVRQATQLSAPDLSQEPIKAELMVLPVTKGQARLVWNLQVWTLDGDHAFDFTVDAETGQVWTRVDWVAADSYRVYPRPVESPNHTAPAPPADGRALVVNPAHATASPFGWHDTNGAAGAEFTTTAGQQRARLCRCEQRQRSGRRQFPELRGRPELRLRHRPDGRPNDLSAGGGDEPVLLEQHHSRRAAPLRVRRARGQLSAEQLRTRRSRQRQRAGRGAGQRGAAPTSSPPNRNNANFATPPDGSRPRMQMYVWTAPTPDKDGDLDAGIIVHEYGHGISNRLVGGPSNVSCLQNAQQPGEGISDWLSLVYTALPGHTGPLARGVGTYALNQPTTGPGIRTLPYSTNGAVNNWTYATISTLPPSSVPHGVGAVWAQGMWEADRALVDQYGFNPDLYNATGGAGNQRAMLYHNEGLKNTACSPGFTQVRDGIIQAAQTINGGADVCRLWTAFAAFGLGADAVNPSPASNAGIVNGFNTPAACGGTVVPTMNIADATVTEGHTGTSAATFTVSLTAASSQEVRATFTTANGTASSPSDYAATSSQVIFTPGQTSRTVQVAVNGDLATESNETFTVTLTAPINATIGDAQGLGTILNDDAVGSVTIAANAGTLGPIPDSGSVTCQVPGSPRDVTFTVAGLTAAPSAVEVTSTMTHSWVGDLVAQLTAPGGANHVVFGYTGATTAGGAGSSTDLSGAYTFRDSSANNWWTTVAGVTTVPPGDYRTGQLGGAGATSTPTSMSPVFAAVSPNGTWTLRFTDGCAGDLGAVTAAALTLTVPATVPPTTSNDSYTATVNTPLTVAAPGVLGNDNSNGGGAMSAELVAAPANGALTLGTNGSFTYTPMPGFIGADVFTYRALAGGGAGNVATVTIAISGIPTTVNDSLSTTYPSALTLPAPGVLGNDASNGGGALSAALVSNVTNGTLTLGANGSVSYTPGFGFVGTDSFTYRAQNAAGAGECCDGHHHGGAADERAGALQLPCRVGGRQHRHAQMGRVADRAAGERLRPRRRPRIPARWRRAFRREAPRRFSRSRRRRARSSSACTGSRARTRARRRTRSRCTSASR